MTLCIAAHAMNHRDITNQIVFCCDALIGDSASTTEDATKWNFIQDRVVAMYSGTKDHADDAIDIYTSRLKASPLTKADCKEQIYVGFKEFKERLKLRGVKRTDLELIIAGFIEGEPRIFYASAHGVQGIHEFVAIGSGALVADAMLRLRKPSSRMDSSQIMYFVYEAKKLGEASPHVGQNITEMWIMEERHPSGSNKLRFEWKRLHKDGLDHLQSQFARFSFQPFTGTVHDFPWKSLHPPKCPM